MSAERVILMAAGKCLSAIEDGDSPYRETRDRLLPNFSLDHGARSTRGSGPEVVPGGLWPAAAPRTAGSGPGDHGANAPAATHPEPAAPGRGAVGNAVEAASWFARLRGFFFRRPEVSVPRLPAMTRRQVQGELSLGEVKVVRNDLKDADVEVVQFRPAAAPAHTPLSLRRGSSGGSATFLRSATSRFFGVR